MKKILSIILSALALTACGSSASENSYEQLSMYKALSQMAKEENYILLDVRTIEEYNDGHIPGAINVANESIGKDEITELPDFKRIQIALISCKRHKLLSCNKLEEIALMPFDVRILDR